VGAETLAHVAQLTRLGCEIAQGFAIARPMPAGKVRAWMSDGKG
jgi:EAL domain-containing protein (putative c-di-GMP-specific phosphodiesterase class I)